VNRTDVGLALLRVGTGAIFTAHGCLKLFTMGIPAVTGYFTQVEAPLPGVTAPLVSVLEFGGGIALVLGLGTRPLALLLALDMLGAIVLVKAAGGFFAPDGLELELLLGVAAAALALAGGGAPSVDAAVAARRGGSPPGPRP
jgi:putative oxidoreductase